MYFSFMRPFENFVSRGVRIQVPSLKEDGRPLSPPPKWERDGGERERSRANQWEVFKKRITIGLGDSQANNREFEYPLFSLSLSKP